MKWRECKNRDNWYTGPSEGRTYWQARKRGKVYKVQAHWHSPISRTGPVVWWSHDGKGVNKCWRTREAAQAWCERDAKAAEEVAA